MDVLSHFFFPFVVALLALGLHRVPRPVMDRAARQTRVAYAVVFGLAGLAPDLDTAFSWMRHLEGFYWLQHRGFSHTLVGAPLHGLIPVGVLHALALWRPARFGRYRFRPGFVPVAILGSWTHLALDLFTYAGVPALWPFAFGRVRLLTPLYHWIVFWMFPIVAVVLGLHLWRRLPLHRVAQVGVALIVLLVVVAGVRAHYVPVFEGAEGFGDPEAEGLPAPFEIQVFSRNAVTEFSVVWPAPGGWKAALYREGSWVGAVRFYPDQVEPGTEAAIRMVQETNAYKGFRMGTFGPVATEAYRVDGEAIRVVFTDVAARFEAENEPRWTPAREDKDWGHVVFEVTEMEVTVLVQGW